MKRDKSTEKQFLEYLDRLLAGEEISPGDDVSDDIRSALEHARKMLAFRQEPSAEFRANLRDSLLRQIARKQAATQPAAKRESLRERMANIFPPRSVLIAVTSTAVVVLLAFIGVVWFAGRGGAPMATVAPPAAPSEAGYSVRLPANIVPEGVSFTAKKSLSDSQGEAAVYRIQSSDITTESVTALGQRLGFSGEAAFIDGGTKIAMYDGAGDDMRQLIVWTASGAVEYGYVEPEKLYPSYPAELPSQSEAELIAYDFLGEAGLLPPGYHSLAKIKDETTVVAGGGYSVSQRYATEAAPPAAAAPSVPSEEAAPVAPSTPTAATYWLVDFPYFVDGTEATGPGSKIEVSVGEGGEVVKMLWSWRQMSPLGTDNIISEKQAYDALIQGKGSLEVPLDCRQVVVEQVRLKYWLDPPSEQQAYAVPVYEFTGQCLDKNGNHLEDFTGWTPALSTN
jgi:hypothetical protein